MISFIIAKHLAAKATPYKINPTKRTPRVLSLSSFRRLNLSLFPIMLGVSKISCSLLKNESSGSIDNHHPVMTS